MGAQRYKWKKVLKVPYLRELRVETRWRAVRAALEHGREWLALGAVMSAYNSPYDFSAYSRGPCGTYLTARTGGLSRKAARLLHRDGFHAARSNWTCHLPTMHHRRPDPAADCRGCGDDSCESEGGL